MSGSRPPLLNKIDPDSGDKILERYKAGTGVPTIAREMRFKTHVVERFVRDSGIMRERRESAAMGIRRVALGNVGKTNAERIK